MISNSVAALFSILALALPSLAQESSPSAPDVKASIAWEPDLDAALATAQSQGRPLFVAFLMDNEPANDDTIARIYTDPALVKLSRKLVCVACCVGDHKGEDGMCKKFPGITCAQHNAIEKKARARWIKSDLVCTPQHVFCHPKGTEIGRKIYYVAKQQLMKAMALAIAAGAKEVDAESKNVVQEEAARVDKLLKDLGSKNQEVRDAAMGELAAADDPRALPAVLSKAKPGNDDGTRISAIRAVGKKGNHQAVMALAPFLSESKVQIVIQAAAALEVIQLPDAVPELLKLLKKEQRDRVRSTALRAAAKSNPESAKVQEICLQAMKGSSSQLQAAAIVALGMLKPDPKNAEAIQPLLASKNQNMRGLAVWAYGNQLTPACATLLDKIAHEDKAAPELRELAAKAVRRCSGDKVEDYENLYRTFFIDYEN